MAVDPATSNNFKVDTDYGLDKVLGTFTGSFTATARFSAFTPRRSLLPTDHGIGDFAFINGSYSFDNSIWYPFGVNVADTSGSLPAFQTVEVNGYCDNIQVVVQATNWTASDRSVYYALQLIAKD